MWSAVQSARGDAVCHSLAVVLCRAIARCGVKKRGSQCSAWDRWCGWRKRQGSRLDAKRVRRHCFHL